MIDPALFGPPPLLADGAPADWLRHAQTEWRGPLEVLNQERPHAVQAMHAAFAAAGARLLRTNTEHANAAALAATGLSERAEALNNSGSALARAGQREAEGAGIPAQPGTGPPAPPGTAGFVMGTVGAPPGAGQVDEPDWQRAYGEQAIYLSDTGVDFFLLQHVSRLGDAVALTRRIGGASDAPVLAALQLDGEGRTADGADARHAAAALAEAGAQALGLSCGPGPQALPACLEALLATGLPVAVLAGIHPADGASPYPGAPALTPAAFAEWLAPLADSGVAILGGCCGVTPAHIRALAHALGR